jgi:hypothetical protein
MHETTIAPGARQLEASPGGFDMLAFRGHGTIWFRWHRAAGAWSEWEAADDDPTWTGAGDAYQVRSTGVVRAFAIWSPVRGAATRALSDAGSPTIVSRSGWGADEEIVKGKPSYAPAIKLAVVHHTAGSNNYTPAQAAAIVRGIEEYHVRGNGWNDIGYNFLVDRFGNVYEGRTGGIDKNVIGAHAEGFNTGTVGVALIGNFAATTPPKAMQDALVRLLAWRLDLAHVDPLSTVAYTSGGNAKFKAGKVVTLHAISGHRDTGPSECPGNGAYALLGAIAKRVAATGLPKLYGPTVSGTLGGPVRFQARLSSSLHWTVTILDQLGKVVASTNGTGATVDWTWQALVAAKGSYTWTIAAPGVHIASGTLGKQTKATPAPALALTAVSADLARLSFTLDETATVNAVVQDGTGTTVQTIVDGSRPAGANAVPWSSEALAAGDYRLVVTATAGGKSVAKWVDLVVDRTVTAFTASAQPDGTTLFSITLSRDAPVELDVRKGDAIVSQVYRGVLPAGAASISWDDDGFGQLLASGGYTATLAVDDAIGAASASIPLTIG